MLPLPLRCLLALTLIVGSVFAGSARAMPMHSDLFVFGDSLSDTGNIFLVLDDLGLPTTTPVPIANNASIANAPYARPVPGALPAFSNGPIWAERVATALGVGPLAPSLAGGNNFAYGDAGMRASNPDDGIPDIGAQIGQFIAGIDTGPLVPDAPADALYAIYAGGNDVRDAVNLAAFLGGAGASQADIDAAVGEIIVDYAAALAGAVGALANEGASDIVVFGVPDVGLTPALLSFGPPAAAGATFISEAFIDAYTQTLDALDAQFAAFQVDVDLLRFDLANLLREVAASPGDFGLTNATDACAANPACLADPSALFFDGIHPTAAANAIIADRFLALVAPVPAPATFALLVVGLAVMRRRIR